MDGPGIDPGNSTVGTIARLRANFREYATVDNVQVSADLNTYIRISVRKTMNGDVIHVQSNITDDNQTGTGSTNLTWNLLP